MPPLPEGILDNLSPAGAQTEELAVGAAVVAKLMVVTYLAQNLVLYFHVNQSAQLVRVIHDENLTFYLNCKISHNIKMKKNMIFNAK